MAFFHIHSELHVHLWGSDLLTRCEALVAMKEAQVSTDLFGRGIDIERVNIVINYDMPDESIQAALLVLTKIGPIRANS